MSLSGLLKKEMVEKVEKDVATAKKLIASARNDLVAAKDTLASGHSDWALAIAYNAMLSAGKALMAKKGYRASSGSHHVAVIQFCAAVLPTESSKLIALFNRYRVRRNDIVYGEAGSVGKDEAQNAIENAAAFVKRIGQDV